MDANRFLREVGAQVARDFVANHSLLSFEEYLSLFLQHPRQQARGAAQYLLDAIDSFGSEEVPHPSGPLRRFKVFDGQGEPQAKVAGQEEVQNAIYRVLSGFTRSGRINRLILLHGPNGSAKSSLVEALKRGLETYSHTPQGALYTFNWVFPAEKLVKGSIGFAERTAAPGALSSFAHLEGESIDVRLPNPLKEHPLFLLPRPQRSALLQEALAGHPDFIVPAYLAEGELSHKSRRVLDALLAANGGDYLKVLRHVQVERFYISRRYQVGTATVEPQLSVDAGSHQVTADRSQANLPYALHSVALFDSAGPLVSANRGLIEYEDLLKRPLEAFKYLLGFSETQEVPLDHFVLQLDEVLIASANEKHLSAFKELPDFASFKGRIELIRVPYLRRWKVEKEIYDAQVTPLAVGRHVAPHATAVAALWATLTRLKKPLGERLPPEVKALAERLTPLEKLKLYQDQQAPERLSQAQQRELKKYAQALYEEADAWPHYEGRVGASARELKTALLNAAQSPEHDSLHPLAVLKELQALTRDKSVYDFLQQDIVDGYHDHQEFLKVVELQYLDWVDREVRESMGLVSEAQYAELFERYVQQVSAWQTGDRLLNRLTGQYERVDEARLAEFEGFVKQRPDEAKEFRKGLVSTIGAWRVDNPTAPVDYAAIFPELFKRLSDHFFEERRRVLKKNVENTLKYFSDERSALSAREQQAVRTLLDTMASRHGYSDGSARDAIVFLMRRRYA